MQQTITAPEAIRLLAESMSKGERPDNLEELLAIEVNVGGRTVKIGEMTPDDFDAYADEVEQS